MLEVARCAHCGREIRRTGPKGRWRKSWWRGYSSLNAPAPTFQQRAACGARMDPLAGHEPDPKEPISTYPSGVRPPPSAVIAFSWSDQSSESGETPTCPPDPLTTRHGGARSPLPEADGTGGGHAAQAPLVPPFRIQRVYDTRKFDEIGDRWVPIDGTGEEHECDRCGRLHEIHAEIVDATGRFAIVGVGCMNATTAEQRRLSSKATRNARKAAKQRAQAAARACFDAHADAVKAMPFPTDQVHRQPSTWGREPAEEWRVQDAGPVIVHQWASHEERMRCLESAWRQRRMQERVGGPDALRALERRAGTSYWG